MSKNKRITVVEWVAVVVLIIILLFVLIERAFCDQSAPPEGLTTDCEIVNIVDGDTIDVRLSYVVRIRLLDCWAPETRTRDLVEKSRGVAAKKYMQALAEKESRVRLHVPGGNSLADILTFGRILGRVWRLDPETGQPEDRDLSEHMVDAHHATKRKNGE